MPIVRGIGGVNREIARMFRSVNGVNREISKEYAGFGGVNRLVFGTNARGALFEYLISYAGSYQGYWVSYAQWIMTSGGNYVNFDTNTARYYDVAVTDGRIATQQYKYIVCKVRFNSGFSTNRDVRFQVVFQHEQHNMRVDDIVFFERRAGSFANGSIHTFYIDISNYTEAYYISIRLFDMAGGQTSSFDVLDMYRIG